MSHELWADRERLRGVGGDRLSKAQALWADEAREAMRWHYARFTGDPYTGLKPPYLGARTWNALDPDAQQEYLNRAQRAVDALIASGAERKPNGGWI